MNTGIVAPYAQPGPSHERTAAALQILLLGLILVSTLFTVDINVIGGAETGISVDPQLVLKLVLWTVGGALAFAHVRQLSRVFTFAGPLLFAATLGLAIFSTSYSLNPVLTLGSCYGAICIALFAALAMRAFTERGFSALLLGAMIVLALVCWLTHFALPGLSGRLAYLTAAGEVSTRVGGLIHPNSLARTAAIALGIGMIMFRQRHLGGPAMIMLSGFSLVTMYASHSRTAVLGLVIGLLAVFLRKISLPALVALIAVGVIGGSAAVAVLINDPAIAVKAVEKLARSGNVEEIYSLTGRVFAWSYAWEQIQQAPLLGYGFGAAREVFAAGQLGPNQWNPGNTHNGLLEVLISLGVVGGALVMLTLVRQLYLYRCQPRDIPDFILFYVIATSTLTAGPFTGVPNGVYILFAISLFWRPLFRTMEGAAVPAYREVPPQVPGPRLR